MSDIRYNPVMHSEENIRLLEERGRSLRLRGLLIIATGAVVCLLLPAVVELRADVVRIMYFAMIGMTLLGSLVTIYGLGKLHSARRYQAINEAHRRSSKRYRR